MSTTLLIAPMFNFNDAADQASNKNRASSGVCGEFNRKRLRTSNRIERFNQSVKQRTKVAKIFANEDSCLRLVSAVIVAISEQWQPSKVSLSLDSD